jgi:hypothetical protein
MQLQSYSCPKIMEQAPCFIKKVQAMYLLAISLPWLSDNIFPNNALLTTKNWDKLICFSYRISEMECYITPKNALGNLYLVTLFSIISLYVL